MKIIRFNKMGMKYRERNKRDIFGFSEEREERKKGRERRGEEGEREKGKGKRQRKDEKEGQREERLQKGKKRERGKKRVK